MGDDIPAIAAKLSGPRKRALLALSAEVWKTASEVKHDATPASLDALYVTHFQRPLCERRWCKWGGERGQKRGEGYEYRLTLLGHAVRDYLKETSHDA
jgi:hypothetical protein